MKKEIRQLLEMKKYGKSMRLAAEKWRYPWQTLLSIILSARTRDEVTIKVCKKLFSEYSLASLAKAKFGEISSLIRPVNFYRNKTKSIISCSKILIGKYDGKVPHSITLLVSLPGVGRKTANVFLSEYNNDTLGVDTHVSYISQKLRWTKHKNPYQIEKDLMNLFPKIYWRKINPTLVRFGKTYTSKKQKDILLAKIAKLS